MSFGVPFKNHNNLFRVGVITFSIYITMPSATLSTAKPYFPDKYPKQGTIRM